MQRGMPGSTAWVCTLWLNCIAPARIASKADWEVGDHSPHHGLSEGEGQPLQEGGERKGEGVEEEHAPLLPEHRQSLTLHLTHIIEYTYHTWPVVVNKTL